MTDANQTDAIERCGSCKRPLDDHGTVIVDNSETRYVCPDIGTGASSDHA